MRIIKKKPPRKFKPSKNITIKDCAKIYNSMCNQIGHRRYVQEYENIRTFVKLA